MTIEATKDYICVCCSHDADFITITARSDSFVFDLTPDPDGVFGDVPTSDETLLPLIVIPAAEALALGHLLIDMAQRQMAQIVEPQTRADETTGPH